MAIGANAPGKLILSGEHAAVYGRPAIAMAVNCYAEAHIEQVESKVISFDIPGLHYHLEYSAEELAALHENRTRAYRQFIQKEISIQEVLPRAVELVPFAFSLIWQKANMPEIANTRVRMEFGIPLGCGMGSSAAAGLAVLRAAASHYRLDLSEEDLFELSMTCERLMHGHPSGVDSYVSLHGGIFRYQGGNVEPRKIPEWGFSLLNTGRPESSTGECVEKVRELHHDDPIWNQFEKVTNALDCHRHEKIDNELLDLIRRNHLLLCDIHVVPARVKKIIAEIEDAGGAAKICGAGAVRGDNAGIVLVVGDMSLESICERYDAHRILCRPTTEGARCIP